jgi:hypothetical protein
MRALIVAAAILRVSAPTTSAAVKPGITARVDLPMHISTTLCSIKLPA